MNGAVDGAKRQLLRMTFPLAVEAFARLIPVTVESNISSDSITLASTMKENSPQSRITNRMPLAEVLVEKPRTVKKSPFEASPFTLSKVYSGTRGSDVALSSPIENPRILTYPETFLTVIDLGGVHAALGLLEPPPPYM